MRVKKLNVSHFRNLSNISISPGPNINFIFGENGSGKTSLLESIYYLGHARSFRTPHKNKLIQQSQTEFVLYTELDKPDPKPNSIGVQCGISDQQIHVNKKAENSKSLLVKTLPIQIINPDVHKIIEEAPRYRRKFIDWGVFHVEPSFVELWPQYQQALKQRNAALKKNWDYQLIKHWDDHLIQITDRITEIKIQYLKLLNKQIRDLLKDVADFQTLRLDYYRGWSEKKSFQSALQDSWEMDVKKGITSVGVHRADLKISNHGELIKHTVSRGQQKFIACLLKIAQAKLYHKMTKQSVVILVDDIASELDATNLKMIIDFLMDTDTQLFITAISKSQLIPYMSRTNFKMFHVEHGKISEVV